VLVDHDSLGYLCTHINERYEIGPEDRVLQFASITFDTSLEQILIPLTVGATLILPERLVAPGELADEIKRQKISVMDLTPAYWRAFLAELEAPRDDLPVRLTIVGGSSVHPEDCRTALSLLPNSRLINAYGLTETTITSCTMELTDAVLPVQGTAPVGTPLPGTTVHILDPQSQPVPAGELGEIHIEGPGVAAGYVTPGPEDERFTGAHSNGTPRRMYRTGDLGRWTSEGNLQVTGRVDRQIKVRGFRVEPAEIEAALTGHPRITDAAVVAFTHQRDERVAGYYTASPPSQPLPSAELRAFLSSRLPGYMVPSVFIQIDAMPVKTNGKVDVSALPDLEAYRGGDAGDAGPLSDGIERAVARIWCQVLNLDEVHPDANFFDLGGNSLLAATLLSKVRASLGILITQVRPLLRLLLQEATLRGFAQAVESARAGALSADEAKQIDFVAESALNVAVQPTVATPANWQDPRHIFLTGATGFLGVYLLRELLEKTNATVHCLVRAASHSAGRDRLLKNMRHYLHDDLQQAWSSGRIVVVPGYLEQPRFGLAEEPFDRLARLVDVVHHPGGLVNFIYPYSHMRPANVEGTREVIRLAARYKNAPVHYTSTMAVISGFGTAGVRRVTEQTPAAHAERLSVGYVESKWVAEALLLNAAQAGLPVAIYRAADISGDQKSGAWNISTEMCAMKKFIVDTGLSPIAPLPLDYTPVDCFAAAVAHIAASRLPAGEVYHLTNPGKANVSVLAERLRVHGHSIREVAWEDWVNQIVETAVEQPEHPMTPFAPLFIDRCSTGEMSVAEMYLESTFPVFTQTNVETALSGSGITIPPVDADMLDRYIRYLTDIDFL
jgi:thioester reductase-like protein